MSVAIPPPMSVAELEAACPLVRYPIVMMTCEGVASLHRHIRHVICSSQKKGAQLRSQQQALSA